MLNFMTDARVWELVNEWMEANRFLIKRAHAKWGWIHGAALEDTRQDIAIHCFKCIRMMEKESAETEVEIDWSGITSDRRLKNRVIGNYHAGAWNGRTDENIRMSDIYNIEPGSEDDCGISCGTLDDVEAWGLFAPVEYSTFNDNEPDAADIYAADCSGAEDMEDMVEALLSILPDTRKDFIKRVCLGGEEGFLTHEEAAEKTSVTRSAVTKSIKKGKEFLAEFCKANGLSRTMPRKKLKEELIKRVKAYRAARNIKESNNIIEYTIFDFGVAEESASSERRNA